MKNLKQHINEALKINSKSKVIKHQRPKNKKELQLLINEHFKNLDSIVLDLTDIDTDLIIDMSCLFEQFSYEQHYSFKIIDVTGWDVSNVEDMSRIFANLFTVEEIKGLQPVSGAGGQHSLLGEPDPGTGEPDRRDEME